MDVAVKHCKSWHENETMPTSAKNGPALAKALWTKQG